jgi:hypothetical protein
MLIPAPVHATALVRPALTTTGAVPLGSTASDARPETKATVIGSPTASAAANAWPAGMAPNQVPVYQRNELFIDASPERVFAWLSRADLWSSYYGNAKNVQVDGAPREPLKLGTHFHWWTFNIPLSTQVAVCEPGKALAWDAHMPGLRAYHKWILVPEGKGTRVITEETDGGFVASLASGFIRGGLAREHQHWLEGLARMVSGGPPPS